VRGIRAKPRRHQKFARNARWEDPNMQIIDAQVHAYERNHPDRPWVGEPVQELLERLGGAAQSEAKTASPP
jgi:hypothetical protein